MEVAERAVKDLIPYARNARTHSDAQIEQMARSIKEFGWTSPILVDEKGELIAGHGRLLAAKRLSIKQVPCIVIPGLTPMQKRALVLADNKIALNAGWDQELLQQELDALAADDFDISLTGFDDEQFVEADAGSPALRSFMTDQVEDVFWISVSGPLPMQADALEGLKKVMAELPGIKVELGSVHLDGDL